MLHERSRHSTSCITETPVSLRTSRIISCELLGVALSVLRQRLKGDPALGYARRSQPACMVRLSHAIHSIRLWPRCECDSGGALQAAYPTPSRSQLCHCAAPIPLTHQSSTRTSSGHPARLRPWCSASRRSGRFWRRCLPTSTCLSCPGSPQPSHPPMCDARHA